MTEFVEKYLDQKECYTVCDVGSYDVNGTFKPLFEQWTYIGIDVSDGPNVDVVVDSYDFGGNKFDVVISGNCMEHVKDLKAWAKAVKKIIKPGGLLCITTPNDIGIHRYPVDCWRVLPDGMEYLFQDLNILECDVSGMDTYLIAKNGN